MDQVIKQFETIKTIENGDPKMIDITEKFNNQNYLKVGNKKYVCCVSRDRSNPTQIGDIAENGLIDDIIPEPLGGAHKDLKWMSKTIKETITSALKELDKIKPEKRIDQRIDKFCSMGVVVE